VRLLEFADFECPFCAQFNAALKALRERYPKQVALTYIHFPLPIHRFAEPAARASECADEQGRFEAMHDRLFEQQNLFGLKAWSDFADDAGVSNREAFENRIQGKLPITRITEGQRLSKPFALCFISIQRAIVSPFD
jgi:protein-disulfide isomerase